MPVVLSQLKAHWYASPVQQVSASRECLYSLRQKLKETTCYQKEFSSTLKPVMSFIHSKERIQACWGFGSLRLAFCWDLFLWKSVGLWYTLKALHTSSVLFFAVLGNRKYLVLQVAVLFLIIPCTYNQVLIQHWILNKYLPHWSSIEIFSLALSRFCYQYASAEIWPQPLVDLVS